MQFVFQSCSHCSDDGLPSENSTNTQRFFRLLDSTDSIKEVSVIGGIYEVRPNAIETECILSTAFDTTTYLVKTNNAIDTIMFLLPRQYNVKASTECENHTTLEVRRVRLSILAHTFDSVYIDSSMIYTSTTYNANYHLRQTICIKP